MTRVNFAIEANLILSPTSTFGMELGFTRGMGPTQIRFGPAANEKPMSLGDIVKQVANMLNLSDELGPVAHLPSNPLWDSIFKVSVKPYLTVELADSPSVLFVIELYSGGGRGVKLPPDLSDYPWLKVEPNFTVYDLIVGYDKQAAKKLDVRARVEIHEQPKTLELGVSADAPPKTELVSYPFPTPAAKSKGLEVNYLGLGQRFGPIVDINATDPIKAMFDILEDAFKTNNPTTLVETLGGYYKPDRDWFIGADIALAGWQVRAVFNDPALYGLEITCDDGLFKDLLFEILYQKLGPGLGVYYGALTLPEHFRRIQLGAVTVVLPSFKIWIYTNGDFKVSVGWPLGENSIGIEVTIFTGGCAFYFAKLRSGDNPGSGHAALLARGSRLGALEDTHDYNPILQFGLGVWLGLGRSFRSGPFSASVSLTLRGTFQGILAWSENAQGSSPDYWWFSASVSLVGELQGEVDLKVVKLSVLVRMSVTASVAFETDYGTIVVLAAQVDVQATLKILFIKITVGFHASIEQSFTLTGGTKGTASINGPQNKQFQGMNDWAISGLDALEATILQTEAERVALALASATDVAPVPRAALAKTDVTLFVFLQPAAVYSGAAGTAMAVVSLLVPSPPPDAKPDDPTTDLEKLLTGLADWLLRTWSTNDSWITVLERIGQGREEPPADWADKLTAFLVDQVSFMLTGLDLTAAEEDAPIHHAAVFPMFPDLQLRWAGHDSDVPFATTAQTYPNYVHVVEDYFEALSLSSISANPDPRGEQRFGAIAATDSGAGPTGPSLVQLTFGDYFLTLARELASALSRRQQDQDMVVMPDKAEATNIGGLTSRYLLHGLRVPDPATTPADHVVLDDLTIASGYALGGQQFAAPTSGDKCWATLSLTTSKSPLASAIHFSDAEKASATATMPIAPAPPAPLPVWSGPSVELAAAAATVTLAALPAAHPHDAWSAQRTRLPWTQGDVAKGFVVPLPTDVLECARVRDRTLTVQVTPPGSSTAEVLTAQPALIVPVTVHLVDRLRTSDADVADPDVPTANDPYVPFVYRMDGTDDETRDRIEALLDGPTAATVHLLYDASKTGYASDVVDLAKHVVLLAKTNLSTTTQPTQVSAQLRTLRTAAPESGLGPTVATVSDTAGFLRLVWEASVVHAGGFFLRYQSADGKGLPSQIFSQSGTPAPVPDDSATLTMLVTFPEGTPLSRCHNAVVVDKVPDTAGTLYLGLSDDGHPVQVLQPSYPPGCVGFTADWAQAHLLARSEGSLHDDDWIASLYHLIQFQVAGAAAGSKPDFHPSLWSLAMSPADKDDKPATDGEDPAPSEHYRQVVPVFRFLGEQGGASSNPYLAVGGRPELQFRLNDVFGNALVDGSHTAPFDVTYNDRLMTPAEWPGVRFDYRFVPPGKPCSGASADAARVCLSLHFDPEGVLPHTSALSAFGLRDGEGDAKVEQAKIVRFRYETVAAQLADPNTALTLATTVFETDGGVIGDQSAIRSALAAFAGHVIAELTAVVDGRDAKPVSSTIAVEIDPRKLALRSDDIFPVRVSLTLSRPSDLVYVDASGARVPGSDSTTILVAADLDPPEGGTERARARAAADPASVPSVDVALTGFARDFEATFAGFDGKSGRARMAVRSGVPDLSAPTDAPSLWGIRWSPTAGIDVAFAPTLGQRFTPAAYFSMTPLAVDLVGGTAQVPSYDDDLNVTTAAQVFSGIDLDDWARAFLVAADRIVSPDTATAIGVIDAGLYQRFMEAKSVLAECLGQGVEPVFVPDGDDPTLLPGDIEEAREQLAQSALGSLATAYTVASIVQVPATVAVAGVAEKGAKTPPRFFGALTPEPAEHQASAVTLTTAKLPIRASSDAAPNYLTFLVSVAEPDKVAHVAMFVTYTVRFVEHLVDPEEEHFDYVPSEWLRIALTGEGDPLDFAVGKIDAPVPSRRFPPVPILGVQQAVQPKPAPRAQAAEKYFQWDYEVELTLPDEAAQDSLWVDAIYNLPLGHQSLMLSAERDELFQALASFTAAWPTLAPLLAGLPGTLAEPRASAAPAPRKIVEVLWNQVRIVAEAWGKLRGVDIPWPVQPGGPVAIAAAGPPEPIRDHYALDFGLVFTDSRLQVDAQAHRADSTAPCTDKEIVWPTVNGKTAVFDSGPRGDCWYRAFCSDFKPPPPGESPRLTLRWPGLDVLTRQTASSSCYRIRNARLSTSERTTDERFVFRTPTVGFANPVVPLLVVPRLPPLPPDRASLAKTLCTALDPLSQAGTATGADRVVQVTVEYAYQLGHGAGGAGVPVTTSVLLANDIGLAPGGDCQTVPPPPDPRTNMTVAQLARLLADDTTAWFRYAAPSTRGATLSLAVVLFADVAGARLPLVRFEAIDVSVPEGWWSDSPVRPRTRR